jgi:hypothetical protein
VTGKLAEIEKRFDESFEYGDLLVAGDIEWLIAKIKQLRGLLQRGLDIDNPNEVDDFDAEVRAALND